MFNPPNFSRNSGSYVDLLKRMTQHVQQKKVDTQMLAILQQAFEQELDKENLMLSRPERTRLFQQITKTVLTDILQKVGGTK